MSKNLNKSLTKEEEKNCKKNNDFLENFLNENSFLLKESKNKCFICLCCTKIPLFLCFFMIAFLFLIILLASFLIVGIYLMKSLYQEINDLYFTNFVIDPIINKKTNSTQSFNIKNEILDSIYLESKLTNMQIAAEFIVDNLESNKDDTNIINKMIKHNSEYNNFKCIRREEENICQSGDTEKNNENNYYIYAKNYDNNFDNFFSGMTHYLKFFENNLIFEDIFDKQFLNIKEYFFYFKIKPDENSVDTEDEFKVLLTYCDNWNTENGLTEDIFQSSNFNNIIKKINSKNKSIEEYKDEDDSNKYVEYILNNDFNDEHINQFNYLKLKTFNITFNEIKYDVLLGIRLDSNSINNLFNKQNSNMTTIAPIIKLTSEEESDALINETELHLLHNSKYFYDFFEYGLKNIISNTNSMRINVEHAELLEYENTNLTTFYNILNYVSKEDDVYHYLYNIQWREDFSTSIKLISNITGNQCLPELSCNGTDDNNYYNILCDIYKQNNNEESEITFNNIKNLENDRVIEDLNITSNYIHEKLKEMGRTKIYYTLVKDAFTDLEQKKSSTKIFYYNSSINNISFNSIEVLNITTYNNLKEEFIKEMEDIEFIVILIRVGFIGLFFIISMIKIIREVIMSINRINSILSLKDMLFNKTEEDKDTLDLLNNDKDYVSRLSKFSEKVEGELLEEENVEESMSDKDDDENKYLYGNTILSEKDKNKLREKWSKTHFYERNFMNEGNKLIIQYTYNKLKNIFENMDFFQNEKFAEKLVFLKRRYKLNEQYEDKDDCELSSDIYQAMSKISLINMDDIFYNVYYNQSYALNQSFKMFKSILDNSINKQSILLKNNKYINFGRILKFIYYVKKEKIQKIIEIIYNKELKYKSKTNDDKKSIINLENNINNIDNDINSTLQITSINSHRKLFNEKSSLFPS